MPLVEDYPARSINVRVLHAAEASQQYVFLYAIIGKVTIINEELYFDIQSKTCNTLDAVFSYG